MDTKVRTTDCPVAKLQNMLRTGELRPWMVEALAHADYEPAYTLMGYDDPTRYDHISGICKCGPCAAEQGTGDWIETMMARAPYLAETLIAALDFCTENLVMDRFERQKVLNEFVINAILYPSEL